MCNTCCFFCRPMQSTQAHNMVDGAIVYTEKKNISLLIILVVFRILNFQPKQIQCIAFVMGWRRTHVSYVSGLHQHKFFSRNFEPDILFCSGIHQTDMRTYAELWCTWYHMTYASFLLYHIKYAWCRKNDYELDFYDS